MNLMEFCNVFEFNNIDGVEIINRGKYILDGGYEKPGALKELVYNSDDGFIPNLRIITVYTYEVSKMDLNSGMKMLHIETVDTPTPAFCETAKEFIDRVFGFNPKGEPVKEMKEKYYEKLKNYFQVNCINANQITKYKRDPYFWMQFLEGEENGRMGV